MKKLILSLLTFTSFSPTLRAQEIPEDLSRLYLKGLECDFQLGRAVKAGPYTVEREEKKIKVAFDTPHSPWVNRETQVTTVKFKDDYEFRFKTLYLLNKDYDMASNTMYLYGILVQKVAGAKTQVVATAQGERLNYGAGGLAYATDIQALTPYQVMLDQNDQVLVPGVDDLHKLVKDGTLPEGTPIRLEVVCKVLR